MPLTPQEKVARLTSILADVSDVRSMRMALAMGAMHGLLAGGAGTQHKPDKIAEVAFACVDAFIDEAVARFFPSDLV